MRYGIFTLVALGIFAAATAHAQITNGSFETPSASAGSYTLYATGSTFDGWTVVGDPGNVAEVSTTFTQGGFNFPAQDGSQWLDLTGISNSATGVQQTVATTTGADYDLSFWVGNVSGGIFGTSSTVEVFVDGASAGTFTNSAGTNTLTWQQFNLHLAASSTATQIEFLNRDPSNDNSNGLDNVTLTPTVVAVPEPGSVVLLAGTGLSGAGFLARRRRNARQAA